jgi:hypothetical protein
MFKDGHLDRLFLIRGDHIAEGLIFGAADHGDQPALTHNTTLSHGPNMGVTSRNRESAGSLAH